MNIAPASGPHEPPQKVRSAAVAGSFYPADSQALSARIDALLAQVAGPPLTGQIFAAVAPHAGYSFSGPVAACTYAALKGHKYARVVVIAPSHIEAFGTTSVYDGAAYATPLGNVQVDTAFAQRLAEMSPTIRLSGQGHDPTSAGAEHAIEVELPWLQTVLGSFELVPIIMGDQSYANSRALGVALQKLIASDEKSVSTLVLASSDLSHYHACADAEAMDRKTLHTLAAWDYFTLSRNFQTRTWEACGGAPIVAAMISAERMGANQARVLKYMNSGEMSGDRSRVVGYGAAIFHHAPGADAAEIPFALSAPEQSELLALARRSVEHVVRNGNLYEPPPSARAMLDQERGAFVTLRQNGALRGCIGSASATKPLLIAVRDMATLAALRDPRFPPVTAVELPLLHYEISVLSPLRRVTRIEQIEVGRHGLLMKNGDQEGLLLPQVPVEQKWDRQTFLEQTCAKARMQPGGWQDEDTDIFRFSADVFADPKP